MRLLRRLPRVTWLFPGVVLVLLALLALTGAAPQRAGGERKRPLDAYGYMEAQTQQFGLPESKKPGVPAGTLTAQRADWNTRPPKYSVVSTGVGLLFPHMGDGLFGDRSLGSTFTLVNNSNQPTNGTIEFYDDAGNPLSLTLNGVAGSVFPFSLAVGQTGRFVTSGAGAPKVGWAHVHSEQPIGGAASFSVRHTSGLLYSEVGVAEGQLGKAFTLFADTIGQGTNTGVAVVNPSDSETIRLNLELLNAAGARVSTAELSLAPRGHLARNLDELFRNVASIAEFEGTIVITSDRDFSGVTLRTVGDLLTSVPMVTPPAADSTRDRLAFSHIGDGAGGGIACATMPILFNTTANTATARMEYFNSDGTPMTVKIGDKTDSAFDYTIPPKGVVRVVTRPTGDVRSGWARAILDRPVSGAAVFQVLDAAGRIVSEMGVEATPLRKRFDLIVDTTGVSNTAVAIANPDAEGYAEAASITMNVYDQMGVRKTTETLEIPALQHRARYLVELFPNFSEIAEFQGRVEFSSSVYITPLTLRQFSDSFKLTSMPALLKQYGFAPTSLLDVAQNLANTSPPLQWTIHQNANDLALQTVRVSAPALGVDATQVNIGQMIGMGYIAADSYSRFFNLVLTNKSPMEFDLLRMTSGGAASDGTGRIEGNPTGGLAIELTLSGSRPYTFVGSAYDTKFFLIAPFVVASQQPGEVTVSSDYLSVASQPAGQAPVRRRDQYAMSFVSGQAGRPQSVSSNPVFFLPGDDITLRGTGLTANSRLICPIEGGGTVEIEPAEVRADGIDVILPEGMVNGEVRVDSGAGPGNALELLTLFGPSFQLNVDSRKGAESPPFHLLFEQPAEQLVMTGFQVDFINADCNLGGLETGAKVGSGTLFLGSTLTVDLLVKSSDPALLVLDAVEEGETTPSAEIRLTKPEGLGTTRLVCTPATAVNDPFLLDGEQISQLDFTGLALKLPPAGQRFGARAMMTSAPTGPGGVDASLQAVRHSLSVTE